MSQPQKKQTFRRGFKKWTDDKVIEIRRQLGLKEYSPVCAFDLCKFFNIPILTPSDIKELPEYYLAELLGNGAASWSAVTIPINNTSHIIIHNPMNTPARQQSDIMHELGHIICEHTLTADHDQACFAGCLRNIDGTKEEEATWFGACLQLPRPAILYCLNRKMSVEDIAKKYNCSTEMAQYRINITGVSKQISRSYRRNRRVYFL